MFCGPEKSFYSTPDALDAEACGAICTANATGCGCFDYRPNSCRLHANHGNHLQSSGAQYSAYVKVKPEDHDFVQSRSFLDQSIEAQRVASIMEDYRKRKGMDVSSSDYAPRGCLVCSPSDPCLFDLIADPEERQDVSKENPNIVAQMVAKLATYTAYIGQKMTPDEYKPYECVTDIRPWWGNFSGPCCRPKTI